MTNLLQLLFVCAVLFGARNASRCPGREWVARAGTEDCYFIYVVNNDPFTPGAEAQTFEGAIEECIIRGGNIFTADDDEELDYVKSRLSSELEQYWFGLSFRLETNTWSWWDGVSQRPFNQNDFPNLTPWVSNANGNGSRTGGVLAFEYPANVVQFQPKSYDEKVGFICKGRFNGRPLCKTEDGWTFDSDRCYLHVPEPHHFGIAQEYCFKEGGVVATINSERENMRMKMWLLKHSNRVAWLGIKITNKTANTAAGDVKWEDGTLITDTAINHWQTDGLDLPNYIRQLDNGHDYCGEIQAMIANNNDWSLQSNCHSRSLPFACESEKTFCPYGWSEHSDPDSGARTCYRRVPEPKSWDEAVRSCQILGAKLVEIRDALTHRVVRDIILTEESFSASIPKMSYWIGARNYKNAQRRFQWQDGTSLTFTDWKNGVQPEVPNQPITVGGPPEPVDYCVLMDGLSTIPQPGIPRGSWDAQLCTEELPYVCAADAAADISIPDTIMPDITCNAPFERFHDGCYMYMETALNREAAQAHCAAQGSYLVTINTVGENQHILGLLKSDAWIGLKATSLNPSTGAGRWPWLYQQANGAPFNGASYDNSINAFKDILASDTRNCFFMRSRQSDHPDLQNKAPGSWYNSECSAAKSFVCYHKGEVGAIPPPEETFDKECGPGWVRGLDFCYLLRPDPTTWHSAKSNCQNTGPLSELLYVTTKSEWMYIKSLAANAGSSFIGPLPAGQVRAKEYWIDFYAAAQDGWHWPYRDDRDRNRLPMAVFNWAQDEPRYGSQNVPHCAFMQDTEDAGWAASYCAVNKPYICKKPRTRVAIITNSTAAPPVTGGFSCLAPFSSIADQCVYLNDTAVSWEDAQDSCHQIGGDLLSIHSAMQYENIGSRIHGSWVGLNSINDPMNPRVFSWSDGSPVSFTPWDISAGSNALYGDTSIFGQANCVVTQRTGYVVYTCEEEKPFACSSTKLSPTEGPDVITIPHDEGCNRWGIGHDRSCYYFGQTATGTGTRPPLNFEEAQTFCRTSYPGSRLLQVDSAREESFISRIIAQFGSDYWIGLKEERNPWDAFKFWLDGTRVLYTKWADGEPHVGPNGALGCVALQGSYNQGRYPGDWYVASCDLVKYALCEAPRAGVLPTRPTTTPGPNRNGCPTGWVQPTTLSGAPSNRCFKAFFGSSNGVTISEGPSGASYPKVSWAIAERFCNGYKTGHLASIETSQENDMVKSILLPDLTVGAEGHNYWIGLREETSPTGALRWAWSDGTPVTNTFFHSAVSHASDVQDCAAFDSATSRWIQQNCDLSWGWVCEVQQGVYRPNDVLPAIPTVIPANRTCGVDNSGAGVWYYIPETDECVFITRRLNTWNGAAYECFQLGSWLAVITAENNAFITESTSQFSTSAGSAQYWIGLHVTNPAEQRHEWINETPLTYARWETGEPNAYTTDTCGLLNSRSGKWIDQQCGRQHPYVCVKPSVGSFIPTPPPTPDRTKGGCAVGWVGFRGDCYYISKAFTEDKTFETALNWCRGMMPHGDLASVLDSAENDFLITQIRHRSNPNVSYVSSNMWLGLKEKSPSSNEWAWTDGSPYQYTNWYYQYPKDPSFVVECIAMMSEINSAGTWKNFVCSGLNGFVCKAPKNMDLPAIQPTSDCPLSGFKRIGGACFRIVEIPGTHGTSWDAARQACRDLNPGDSRTDIATIHDIYENAFIRIMGEEMRTAGSFDVQAWIGMQERDGGYHWYNNCPATFTDIGSLINHPVEDQCLYQSGGHWVSTDCDTLGINYAVCEQRLTPCPVIANLTGGECPANFTRECSNHCFHIEGAYIHDNRTTRIGFAEARQLCRDLGGDLASVRNAEDQKCIFSYIQSAVWGHWIGLVYTFEGGLGRWQWLDEAMGLGPAVYTNWGTGEPNGASGSESCVEMYPNGYWNNVLCRNTVTRGYICQAPKRNIEVAKTTVVWTAPPTIARTTKAPATSPGPTIVVPVTSSPAFTGPQEGSTTHPVGQPGGKEAPGMSGGDVAGLVIGLLIAMTIIGAAAFMYLTGKTPRDVLRRFQTVGSSVRESTIHFTPKKYRKRADDREEIVVSPATGGGNPNYSGTDSETYT